MHHMAQEVEPVHSEPQAFALTHARASSQDHKHPISGGHCVSSRVHRLDGQRLDP
jgi:hypothetical protein